MSLRPALLGAAILATAFGTSLALRRWGGERNADLSDLGRAFQHGQELESQVEAVRRRYRAKRALAAEIVAGRMSLGEAAGHFHRLDEADPGYPPDSPRPPGDEQALAAQVRYFLWEVLGEQKRYAAAARLYAEAITAEPQLLAGPPTGHRYWAACAAAMAGCGQGRDADNLDEESRAGDLSLGECSRIWGCRRRSGGAGGSFSSVNAWLVSPARSRWALPFRRPARACAGQASDHPGPFTAG
jgi:hypothetical protein